jgi:hypothetical protein
MIGFDKPGHVDRILAQLQRSRPKTNGGWTARCPAHEDHNSSLSIDVRDGRILLKCFAGCDAESIVRAVGLTMADLFDEQTQPVRTSSPLRRGSGGQYGPRPLRRLRRASPISHMRGISPPSFSDRFVGKTFHPGC